jgi:hypothetical protein
MAVQLADLDVRKESSPIFGSDQFLDLVLRGKTMLQYSIEGEQVGFFYSWLFQRILLNPIQETETQTLDVEVNYGHIYHITNLISFTNLISSVKKKREPRELEHEALLNIAMEFSKVEKVKSIYFQRYREEIQVHILLSITQYETDLMDSLLDIEYDLRKKYPELVFEFFYPPAGISAKKDFIHPKAQCIYVG